MQVCLIIDIVYHAHLRATCLTMGHSMFPTALTGGTTRSLKTSSLVTFTHALSVNPDIAFHQGGGAALHLVCPGPVSKVQETFCVSIFLSLQDRPVP